TRRISRIHSQLWLQSRRSLAPQRSPTISGVDQGQAGRAGTQDRFAQKFEAGEIRGTTPRTLWFGQSPLPPFHQSNPTLRPFGGPSHAASAQFAATIH